MPVPKRKKSRARRDNRRSHLHLPTRSSQKCPHCGAARLPHRVCISCGFYGDVEVLRMKEVK